MGISDKLRKKLEKRQKANASSGKFKYIIFKDEGTKRLRPLPVGEDNDFLQEVFYFYLGSEVKGVISPTTFGEKCYITKKIEEMKNSKDEADRNFAKEYSPRRKWLMMVLPKKEIDGKEVDTELGPMLVLLGIEQQKAITDLFLDEEQGDFTDPKDGYDLKFKRTGKGRLDTKYSVMPCKPSPIPKEYRKQYDLEGAVRAIIPTYEETKDLWKQFMGNKPEPEESNSEKRMKKKKSDL